MVRHRGRLDATARESCEPTEPDKPGQSYLPVNAAEPDESGESLKSDDPTKPNDPVDPGEHDRPRESGGSGQCPVTASSR